MKPKVIIVNGYPQSGKDTFCEYADKIYECINYSTVETVKGMACEMGWDGEKTPKSREMLSAFKDFYVEWFDGTYREMINLMMYEYSTHTTKDFIFMHMREPEEIQRIVDWCSLSYVECYTVQFNRDEVKNKEQTNHADKNVDNYSYDVYIKNNGTLSELEENSMKLLHGILNGELKEALEAR